MWGWEDVPGPGCLHLQPRLCFHLCRIELSAVSEAIIYFMEQGCFKVQEHLIGLYPMLDGGNIGESHSGRFQQTQTQEKNCSDQTWITPQAWARIGSKADVRQ